MDRGIERLNSRASLCGTMEAHCYRGALLWGGRGERVERRAHNRGRGCACAARRSQIHSVDQTEMMDRRINCSHSRASPYGG